MLLDWVPPVFEGALDRVRQGVDQGRFRAADSWTAAEQATQGYERRPPLLEGTPWDRSPGSLSAPELQMAAALGISLHHVGRPNVHVLDLGGAFGAHYGLARCLFPATEWTWIVSETAAVRRAVSGVPHGPDALQWIEGIPPEGLFDVALASGVVQHLNSPDAVLAELCQRSRFVVLNRLPLWPLPAHRPARQYVEGRPAYPAWFLSETSLRRLVASLGTIVAEWTCPDDRAFFAGHRRHYSGLLIQTHA